MKTGKPKILFFVTEDWFVCSHWLPLIAGANNAGFEVVVVTKVNKHADKIIKEGARVVPINISRRGSNLICELKIILQLFSIYRQERPDIVHHVAMKPMLYGSLVSHLLRIPSIINWVAGMGWIFVSNYWWAKILKIVVLKVFGVLLHRSFVVVENKDDQKIISGVGIGSSNIHLVRGAGVDTMLYRPSPEPDGIPVVVLPARMLWDKGVGEFVDAASLLKQRGIEARFVLVGAADPENPASVSEAQLLDWKNGGTVEWWGRHENMPYVLAQSHIVCLPSYREGLPKSLLEAASCGRPIVTTDVPGCREIVLDGDNGFLVEVHNSTALADAIEKLLVDKKLRQQMGSRGRELVEKEFSQEKIVSDVLMLYRQALS